MTELRYESTPETKLAIDLPGSDLQITGLLRGSFEQPLVVMMHGLSGEANSLIQFLGARYLHGRGFATLRLNMYGDDDNQRDLADCTMQTHADDFDTVVEHVRRQGARQAFAEAHSYGGMAILLSKSELDGAVLWDPAHGYAFRGQDKLPRRVVFDGGEAYFKGTGMVLSDVVLQDQASFKDTTSWAAHKGYPLKIISAGKGILSGYAEQYLAVADAPKEHFTIEEAHHGFDDSDAVMMKLFEETANWLERFTS